MLSCENLTSNNVEIRWLGVYIDVSQKNTRHNASENT